MREQLVQVWTDIQNRAPGALMFEAEGVQYVRRFLPRERLILLGCGHIAQPVCSFAAALGFSVAAVDDRPSFANRLRFPEAEKVVCNTFPKAIEALEINARDYVAVLTRGHRYDADCLREILAGPFPQYLGMIGSPRRVSGLFRLLESEGFAREQLEKIHAPIGVEIGALTPKEIAISIVAELIQCRRQDKEKPTDGTVLIGEDIDLPLLEHLACDETPKALLVVYETSGSTPVKTGAMMTVDRDYHTVGSIGGGCSENAVMLEAYQLIGTGAQRCVTIQMTSDIAEEEGMVCGGQMKVLIADVGT